MLDTIDMSFGVDEASNKSTEDLHPAVEGGKVIVSTSATGGAGKTTAAVLTASILYHASKAAVDNSTRAEPLKVVLVDLDVRDGQLGLIAGRRSPNAYELHSNSGERPSDAEVLDSLVFSEALGVHLLVSPPLPCSAVALTSDFYVHVIESLKKEFDVVVVDTSVNYLDPLLKSVAYPLADEIMLVTTPNSNYDMLSTSRWVRENVTEGTVNASKVKAVLNKVNEASEHYGHLVPLKIIGSVERDSQEFIRSLSTMTLEELVLHNKSVSSTYLGIITQLFPEEQLVSPLQ